MGRGRRVWRTPPKRVKAHPRRGVGGSLARLTRVEEEEVVVVVVARCVV